MKGGLRVAGQEKKIGAPRRSVDAESACVVCGKRFTWRKFSDGRPDRVCCSKRRCSQTMAWRARQILPPPEEIARMYAANFSTTEIARICGVTDPGTVRKVMVLNGIPRRRKTVVLVCKVTGCKDPVKKVRHAANGAEYGGWCEAHRKEHLRLLGRGYNRIPAEKQEPWRWTENLTEEDLWIRKSRKLLKQTLAVISQLNHAVLL